MARDEARIKVSIWSDPTFLALSPGAKLTYLQLLSQPDVSWCGLMAFTVKRWAVQQNVTEALLRKSLTELAEDKFVVVDEDHEELLLRSLMRHNNVGAVAQVFVRACRDAALAHSPAIKEAIKEELRRVAVITTGAWADRARKALSEALGEEPNKALSDRASDRPSEGLSDRPLSASASARASNESESKKKVLRGETESKPQQKPLTLLAEDWQPDDKQIEWARANYPTVNLAAETEKFHNYWPAARDNLKRDWPATWRTWIQRASERAPQGKHLKSVPAALEKTDDDVAFFAKWGGATIPKDVDQAVLDEWMARKRRLFPNGYLGPTGMWVRNEVVS